MASEGLYQGFISERPEATFFHGHSFTANPLGCAAALASLDLQQGNPERYQQFQVRHMPLLEALAEHPLVRLPRCLGTMAAFDVEAGEVSYFNPVGKYLQALCLQQGVHLRPLGDVVSVLSPLDIKADQLEGCYWALAAALDQLGPQR